MNGLRSGDRGCLMNMVDDATTTTCCRLGEQETIWAAVGVLRSWIGKYGVPRALYEPAQDHPWRQGYERRMKAQSLQPSPVSSLLGVSASASP
jgi:hypothetical protein